MPANEIIAIISLAISCVVSGFMCGYYAGKRQNPTVTEQTKLYPEVKEHIPDSQDWETSVLIYCNGKVTSVICDWLNRKQCKISSHKCRFFHA